MNPVTIAISLENESNDYSLNEMEAVCMACKNSQKVSLVKSKRNRMIMIDPDSTCSKCSQKGHFV